MQSPSYRDDSKQTTVAKQRVARALSNNAHTRLPRARRPALVWSSRSKTYCVVAAHTLIFTQNITLYLFRVYIYVGGVCVCIWGWWWVPSGCRYTDVFCGKVKNIQLDSRKHAPLVFFCFFHHSSFINFFLSTWFALILARKHVRCACVGARICGIYIYIYILRKFDQF